MTDPDRQQLDDLIKAALVVFVMLGDRNHLAIHTHMDNPEIGADEVVELTITRTRIIPPQHPLPIAETFAGVLGYAEGVTA